MALACASCSSQKDNHERIYPVSGKLTYNVHLPPVPSSFFAAGTPKRTLDREIMGVVEGDGSFEIVSGPWGKCALRWDTPICSSNGRVSPDWEGNGHKPAPTCCKAATPIHGVRCCTPRSKPKRISFRPLSPWGNRVCRKGEPEQNFLEATHDDAELRVELPAFAVRDQDIFDLRQLDEYLEKARQTEPFDMQT